MLSKYDEKYDKFNRIQSIVEFIEKNYAENHSVDFYAEACKLEKYYFIKLFGEYTGVSPKTFRKNLKVNRDFSIAALFKLLLCIDFFKNSIL